MKRWNFILAITISTIAFTSCSKTDVPNVTVTDAAAKATGTWRVNYYFDNSNGVSSYFDGYTFKISDDGSLVATIDSMTHDGVWIVKNSDDNPDFTTEMEFTISGDDRMDKLDGNWLIKSIGDSTMELIDDSSPEEIHFIKI